MAGEYASCASCSIAQCSRRSNRQWVRNSSFFFSSFLKQQHCVSVWLEYLGTVAPLNGAVYHHTLSGAVGVLLLNHSLCIYFARSGNEDCILFCDIFSNWKISFSVLILCLDVFVLSLSTEVPFYQFFNRRIPSRTEQMDGTLIPWISVFFPSLVTAP